MKLLVTGTAGFIGHHVALRLAGDGHEVVGLDSINDYYDPRLKHARLSRQGIDPDAANEWKRQDSKHVDGLSFIRGQIEAPDRVLSLFENGHFDRVCHLAAQAGVRYSLINPHAYIGSNITAFLNILEGCRQTPPEHLVYASSSSVYGLDKQQPFREHRGAGHPVSLYGATKRTNELMAHSYAHLFGVPGTGLRFFTVYGPWGRPDMALFLFTDAIIDGREIEIFNYGEMSRDFTYIDDIVEGVVAIVTNSQVGTDRWNGEDLDRSPAPHRVYNIGNSTPVALADFVSAIESAVGKKAKVVRRPMQPGDVAHTWADCSALETDFAYKPHTDVEVGVKRYVEWFRDFYRK